MKSGFFFVCRFFSGEYRVEHGSKGKGNHHSDNRDKDGGYAELPEETTDNAAHIGDGQKHHKVGQGGADYSQVNLVGALAAAWAALNLLCR